MKCLLCASDNVIVKEKHLRSDLLRAWKRVDINIENEIGLDEIVVYECPNCGLRFFDPRLAGGDRFYSELGKQDWYYLHDGKTEYDYVQKFIRDGQKILDIGAGRGVLYTKIKKIVDYTGLELSTKAVALAKEAGINVLQEDLLKYAQHHQSEFDIVCLFQVLEHLTELDNFINSIRVALKNEGLFVIAVPNNEGFISHTPNYTFNLPPHHTILWTEKSLRFLAKKFGFEVVEVEKELLQDVHRESAYHSYITNRIRKWRSIPTRLIDYSKEQADADWKAQKLAEKKWFRRFIMPIVHRKQKLGQSIIVTLRKK